MADLVPDELLRAGVQKIFHHVSVKPGKPVWFGRKDHLPAGIRASRQSRGENSLDSPVVPETSYVFGLPGNPVSSMVCFELFVRPALQRWAGATSAVPALFQARLETEFQHQADRSTWFPANWTVSGTTLVVKPVPWKGSADVRSTVDANCSLSVPAGKIQWSSGTEVTILPWGKCSLTGLTD